MQAAAPRPEPPAGHEPPLRAVPARDRAPDHPGPDSGGQKDAPLAPVVPLVRGDGLRWSGGHEGAEAHRAGGPSRVQALALLLVLPLALIATVAIIRPGHTAGAPKVLVIGPVAATRWAYVSLSGMGPVVLSSAAASQPTPTATEIRYRGTAARAQAEAVRRSLGRGRLLDVAASDQSFPVIVYLGKDTPAP